MKPRMVVGCMTGTSLDGLDASLVKIEGKSLHVRARHVRSVSLPLGDLQRGLRSLADRQPMTAEQIASLAREFSLLHARAIQQLIGADSIHLICVHGQTVFHNPPASWQLFNPAPLAHALGVPVVFDLRAADLAAGGQGAPITPIADAILFRIRPSEAAVINLGGFCNATCLPKPANFDAARSIRPELPGIRALDICPCNQLLDRIARTMLNQPFDDGGRSAASGTPDPVALQELIDCFTKLLDQKRSLGTGDESWEWIERHRKRLSPADVAATACHAIARTIAHTITTLVGPVRTVWLAGGGSRNHALVAAIRASFPGMVQTTDPIGVPFEYRESICFAILGALCQDGEPITLPQVTGCPFPPPLSGVWAFPRPANTLH